MERNPQETLKPVFDPVALEQKNFINPERQEIIDAALKSIDDVVARQNKL